MPLQERAKLSLLMTSAKHGGFALGKLLFDRFWPDFLRPQQPPAQAPPEEPDEFELNTTPPIPGFEVEQIMESRKHKGNQ